MGVDMAELMLKSDVSLWATHGGLNKSYIKTLDCAMYELRTLSRALSQ
jgi:hypothetical protein